MGWTETHTRRKRTGREGSPCGYGMGVVTFGGDGSWMEHGGFAGVIVGQHGAGPVSTRFRAIASGQRGKDT